MGRSSPSTGLRAALPAALLALCAGCSTLPISEADAEPEGTRRIRFAGYFWDVKRSEGRVGPGGNFFSDSASSVFVDESGSLRLRLREEGGRWYAAELCLARSLGYGTYRLELGSRVDGLDPNVVVGLFTWSDAPEHANRELDIEFARWGDPGGGVRRTVRRTARGARLDLLVPPGAGRGGRELRPPMVSRPRGIRRPPRRRGLGLLGPEGPSRGRRAFPDQPVPLPRQASLGRQGGRARRKRILLRAL